MVAPGQRAAIARPRTSTATGQIRDAVAQQSDRVPVDPGVAFGAGLFIAFDELWRWNSIVALCYRCWSFWTGGWGAGGS